MQRAGNVCMLLHRSAEHDARVRREATALAEAGYDVTILEFAPSGPPLAGVRRRSVLPSWVARVLPLRARQAVLAAAFATWVALLRPDVVHAHDLLMLAPALVGARAGGGRVLYDTHELATGVTYRRGVVKRVSDALEAAGITRAAAVMTVSDSIADRLSELYALRGRPVVLRNVCALPRLNGDGPHRPLRRRLGLGSEPLVLHQGAALLHRGCSTLVSAVALVPGAHLAFLGPCGPAYAERLSREAAEAGVADRVHFAPTAPLGSLLAHTRDADVGVALFEPTSENYRLTLPNKLFEYVAAGVPVVTSDAPELERLVREHAIGWTADATDPAAVAAALRAALATRADAEVTRRLAAADAAFSWQLEREVLLGVYRSLSAPRGSSAAYSPSSTSA